jgi:hypothetical protein
MVPNRFDRFGRKAVRAEHFTECLLASYTWLPKAETGERP